MSEGEGGRGPTSMQAGLKGRCPRCGRGHLFRGFLAVAERCEVCDLDFEFIDAGDGPAVFVILIVGFIVCGAALIVEVAYEPPYWVQGVIWVPLLVPLCLGLLRPLKGWLIASQYRHKAELGRLADP